MSFAQAVASVWSNWTDFDGRARRSEYWYWHLFLWLMAICVFVGANGIGLLNGDLPDAAHYAKLAAVLFFVLAIIPSLAVMVRRLHDIGASGWLILIGLVPFVGSLILLFLVILPGTRGENRFGPDSREEFDHAVGANEPMIGQDGHLAQFRPERIAISPRRGPPVVLIVFTLAAIGAGAFYFLKNPVSWTSLTSVAHTDNTWILPEGTPSMGEAQDCLRSANLACAEADMLAYLKEYPNDAHATALLAITLTEDGRHKEALYYYKKAETLGVTTYDFYAGYARTLDAMGDTDGAIAKNEIALKLVPSLVDVRGALAEQLARKGRKREALELLTSFDDQLQSQGYPPYFTEQIRRLKNDMGGDLAKEETLPKAAPGQTLIRGEPYHGTLAVPVSIDGTDARPFTIDSGASMLFMPFADAQQLLQRGLIRPGDYRGLQQVQLANGTIVTAQLYNLRSVKVGDLEINDVTSAVYPGEGPRLLGQSFLKRVKSWSIDNDKRVLVLND